MEDRLRDLYSSSYASDPQEIYLEDLAVHCAHVEERLRAIMPSMPEKQRQIVEEYMSLRNELEFYTVKRALHFSKYVKSIK